MTEKKARTKRTGGHNRSLLVISDKTDLTADSLIVAANRLDVSSYRLHSSDLISLDCSIQHRGTNISVAISALGIEREDSLGVVYRRPGDPCDASWADDVKEYARAEWADFVEVLGSLPGNVWLSDPLLVRRAENKVLQIVTATACGLKVPKSCITNSIAAFEKFRNHCERTVAKALGTASFGSEPFARFSYAFTVDSSSLPRPENLAIAPVTFQEFLAVEEHLRVTVVGKEIFAVEVRPVDLCTDDIDWRRSRVAPELSVVTLPEDVERSILLMLNRLGLRFCSLDLIAANGDHYFLDLNPNGEWGWIEKRTGLRIAEAIVRLVCLIP